MAGVDPPLAKIRDEPATRTTLSRLFSVVAWFAFFSMFCRALEDALDVRCLPADKPVAAEQRKGKPESLQFHVQTADIVLQPQPRWFASPQPGNTAPRPKLREFLDI